MNLQFIKYFVTLAETKNFTKAASRSHVVQSTFSVGIKKLEEQLGTQLFNRTSKSVSLTPAGEDLLPQAKKMLNLWEGIENKFTIRPPQLNLGLLDSICVNIISGILKQFNDEQEAVQVHLTEGSIQELMQNMDNGQLDAFFADADTALIDPIMYDYKHVLTEDLEVAVPLDHPLNSKGSISLKELDGEPYIERARCPLFPLVKKEMEQRKIQLNNVFKAHNDAAVTSLVANGIGVSLLARPFIPIQGVDFHPLEDASFKRKIYLFWKKNTLSAPLQQFLEI